MTALFNLLKPLAPNSLITEAELNLDYSELDDLLYDLGRQKNLLVEVVSDLNLRHQLQSLFLTPELFWAYVRDKIIGNQWTVLVSNLIKNKEDELLIELGLFDNGLAEVSSPVRAELTQFIISRPDYFTWRYLSDSFLEKYEGFNGLKFYNLVEHFYEFVIPNLSGEDLLVFLKRNKLGTIPKNISQEQKTQLIEHFFLLSKNVSGFAFEEDNLPLAQDCFAVFSQIKYNLDRNQFLVYLVFLLDKARGEKDKNKIIKILAENFSKEEVEAHYSGLKEFSFDGAKFDAKLKKREIPKEVGNAFNEKFEQDQLKAFKADNFEAVTEIQLLIGKRIPFETKVLLSRNFITRSQNVLKNYYLSDFFKPSEKKDFFNILIKENGELGREFLKENLSDIKLSPEEVSLYLGAEESISKLDPKSILALVTKKLVTVDDVLTINLNSDSLDPKLVILLAKNSFLTDRHWQQISTAELHNEWLKLIPVSVFNENFDQYVSMRKSHLLIKYPNITTAQKEMLIKATSFYSLDNLLETTLGPNDLLLIFEKIKAQPLKKEIKTILAALLAQPQCSDDIKMEILNKLVKSKEAFNLLTPYLHLLDEKLRKKLQTSSLKNETEILDILDTSTDRALRTRALTALVAFDDSAKSYVKTCSNSEDLMVLKDLVVEKKLSRLAFSLLQSNNSFKKELIQHFTFSNIHGSDLDIVATVLNADELELFIENQNSSYFLNKIPKSVLSSISRNDSLGSANVFKALDRPFPATLVKYLPEVDVEDVFCNLSVKNRGAVLSFLISSSEITELSERISQRLTKEEWPMVLNSSKTNWTAFDVFISLHHKKIDNKGLLSLFKIISENETKVTQLLEKINKYELRRIASEVPQLKELHSKFTQAAENSTINTLSLVDLIKSSFSLAQIIAVRDQEMLIYKQEEDELLELIPKVPEKIIPILMAWVPARELNLAHLKSLAPFMDQFNCSDYLADSFKIKMERMDETTPELFAPSQFSAQAKQNISKSLLNTMRRRELPEWVLNFIDFSSISAEEFILSPTLRNYYIDKQNSPEAINFVKQVLAESPDVIKYLVNSPVNSEGLFFKLCVSFIFKQDLKYLTFEYEEESFKVLLWGSLIFHSRHGKSVYSSLTKEQEAVVLKSMDLFLNLPEVIKGDFFTLTNEFVPQVSVPRQFLKLKIKSTALFSKEQLLELIHKKIDLKLPAVATKAMNSSNEAESYYDLTVDFKETFSAPVKEEFDSLLKNKEGLFQKLAQGEELLPISTRRWGFELEFSSSVPRTKLGIDFKKQGFTVDVANHYHESTGGTWDFKQDSSLSSVNGGFTIEVASPILQGEDGVGEAKRFLDLLFKTTKVNTGSESNSGLHVHHEVIDIITKKDQIKELVNSLSYYQEPLFALCDSYRQKNEYCAKLYSNEYPEFRFNHRHGFNFSSKGTLEFRMREALNNTPEIIRWIKLTQKIVEDLVLSVKKEENNFIEAVTKTISLLEEEKIRQVQKTNNLESLEQFLAAKEYSKILLSKDFKR